MKKLKAEVEKLEAEKESLRKYKDLAQGLVKKAGEMQALVEGGPVSKKAPSKRQESRSRSPPPTKKGRPSAAAGSAAQQQAQAGTSSSACDDWPSFSLKDQHRKKVLCPTNEKPEDRTCDNFVRPEYLKYGGPHHTSSHSAIPKAEWNRLLKKINGQEKKKK